MRPGAVMPDPAPRSSPSSICVVESPSAAARLDAAAQFVRAHPPGTEVVIAAASRQAADDFVRDLAAGRPSPACPEPLDKCSGLPERSRRERARLLLGESKGATFGLRRFSLLQLAAFIATPDLAARGLAPASPLGVEAIATRATFDACRDNGLVYMAPIADRPGFPSALCDTIVDLRGAGIAAATLPPSDACLGDLAGLLARFEAQLDSFRIADVAMLLHVAAAAVREGRSPITRAPLLLLDVPVDTDAIARFVSSLTEACARALITVPAHDLRTLEWLGTLRNVHQVQALPPASTGDGQLVQVQSHLFQLDLAATPPATGDTITEVDLFSAPGEGREAIEIARRVLAEARRGTPLDRMAVLVRAPQVYGALLETAFRRAGIAAWFARGTKRPDPSGRAFLALLGCALERLSARRFAEYLSLGEVPDPSDAAADSPPAIARWVPADDELLREPAAIDDAHAGSQDAPIPAPTDDIAGNGRPVVAGTLRAPWRWEELLVEAAVIGSRDRWKRRLDGLTRDFELRLQEAESEDSDSPRARGIRRDLRNLEHLHTFAMPVIDRLASLPARARWGEWLDRLGDLAPIVLRRPDRALAVLAELRPMSQVGPVTLEEVHRVLATHLSQLRHEPPAQRFGAIFVGTPEQARGRTFDVVFVPGLAERVFPQRAREDPLLVDDRRRQVAARLPLREDVAQKERLLLRIAVGAASRRLHLSYPSMELAQARARVPSFYALDVERARTGRVPDFEVLSARAQRSSGARLAWPAPADAQAAIDDAERDLSVLARLLHLQQQDRAAAKGRARFLLAVNPHLARALRARWSRAQRQWSAADGLYNPGADARAVLAAHRLRARPYSVSALQRFAACPYQFLLGAIHRLEPRAESAWLEQLDPLQRGEIFHRVQADVVRWLLEDDRLRRAVAGLQRHREMGPGPLITGLSRGLAPLSEAAFEALDRVLDSVADKYYEELAPAIDRVWRSEIEAMRTDLRGWLQRLLDGATDWQPRHAELGFGFGPGEGRDPGSIESPVTLAGGWQLHGIVDLVERRAAPGGVPSAAAAPGCPGETLRVTDHKTGRARTPEGVMVGGGEALQPVLYAMALEIALGRPVEAGRLFYCTLAGRYEERIVPLDAHARRSGREVLEIIDRAVEQGTLPPAPREGACQYCDFRTVCGPDEERRIARKDQRPLADVLYLRGLR